MTVVLSRRANRDVRDIWSWNAEAYGERHANEYVAFLYSEMERLGDRTEQSRSVPGHPDLLQLTMRRGSRGHGHIAFYRVEDDTVRIVRVLHTARDWPNLLGEP